MSKAKSKVPAWVVLANTAHTGGLRCLRCGVFVPMPSPMPADAFGPWTEYVGVSHQHCRDTGRSDAPATTVDEWYRGFDTGTSSKAIYRQMQRFPQLDPHSWPRDPDDFGRCYRLLALAPEWRARIVEMAQHGPEWRALGLAWDELTALYEEELPSGICPKLYARMHELTRPLDVGGAA